VQFLPGTKIYRGEGGQGKIIKNGILGLTTGYMVPPEKYPRRLQKKKRRQNLFPSLKKNLN